MHNPKIRSYNMSQINGKDIVTEEKVCKHLFACGFRYRKNDARLLGKPDIVLPKYNTVVFANGCFWYKHVVANILYGQRIMLNFSVKK